LRNLSLWCASLLCVSAVAVFAQQADAPRKSAAKVPAFTVAQAERGKDVYAANCTGCHLAGLDGSSNPTANVKGAPLIGARFVQDFGEAKISGLFNKMQRDMPNGKPGSLTEQQYLDLTAYVLQQNKYPAGDAELTVDAATDIWIPGAGGAEGIANNTYVSGVGCLNQDPTRSWMLTKAQELKKSDAAPGATPVAFTTAPGEYTFRLLNAYNYTPEPQNGHQVRVSGYLVRLGAEIRVYVQDLQMVSATCGNAGAATAPVVRAAPVLVQPPQPPAAALPPPPRIQTVWSGVYSEAQAFRGEKVADTQCQGCHGAGLAGGDSGPKLVGDDFLAAWTGQSVSRLFDYIHDRMPSNAPGTLKEEDVASVTAYILKVNGMPSGRQELPTREAMGQISILAAKPANP
jgi:mono/diheme cytochrome c family protein